MRIFTIEALASHKVKEIDDSFKADDFYHWASQGYYFIWTGDFQNAKQLLQAVQRRINSRTDSRKGPRIELEPSVFHAHRQKQSHTAQMLNRLLIKIDPEFNCSNSRAPHIQMALAESLLPPRPTTDFYISLRELLGAIGAHEWRKNGVFIKSLNAKIHPHYAVFSPVRGEYLGLIEKAKLPEPCKTALDVGTGTGVIAALLAKKAVPHIVATDMSERALLCAKDNFERLGLQTTIELQKTDLFVDKQFDLIVCNPPWLPARPTTEIENALYDDGGKMLKNFLKNAKYHLTASGEAWLIMSDFAIHLGLRKPNELVELIETNGWLIKEKLDTLPTHKKATDLNDPLSVARSKEVTSLYRLVLGKKRDESLPNP